jgi:photosystem II stability/assembly factor-like uncharacterized protein
MTPPRAVMPCPSATGVGVWEDVSPESFASPPNNQTLAVAVDPLSGIVYAAAGNVTNGGACPAGQQCPSASTGLYKSADCGATWTPTGTRNADLLTGNPWAFLIDPVKPETMYLCNGYGNGPTLYKSTNAGVDFMPLQPDASHVLALTFVQAIAMDSSNTSHLAVTFHVDCGAPFTPVCFSQTPDGGVTWHEFNGPAQLTGWQEGASLSILGTLTYLYTGPNGAWFTSDEGKTWKNVIAPGIFGRYAGSTHLAPDGTLYLGVSNTGLFSSRADPTANPPGLLGSSWKQIPNSPQAVVIIDDGVNLIAAAANGPPFYTATITDGTTWTQMSTPIIHDGSNQLAYDPIHHIVYSAEFGNGLLRLVTR